MSRNVQNREAWVAEKLRKIPPGSRMLDAGAGEQRYRNSCEHLSYVSQDFAKYDGTGDDAGLQTGEWDQTGLDIVCDITAVPEPDRSFDAILCTEVFEHLPDPISALREFSRLLRPGGDLILTAPFCSLTHYSPYHYYSGFNRYFYQNHLPECGFLIEEIEVNGNYFDYLAQEVGRIRSVSRKYAGAMPTFLERRALKTVIKMLNRCSENDTTSSELLTFGFHVHATKEK